MSTGRIWRIVRRSAIVAAVIGIIAIVWIVAALRADRPVTYDSITEHFKYGSIGSEPGVSLMRPVGGALPPYTLSDDDKRAVVEYLKTSRL